MTDHPRDVIDRARIQARFVVALFAGDRQLGRCEDIDRDVLLLDPACSIVVEGGAHGADRIAARAAKRAGIHVATVHALWDKFGNSAGPERNLAMTWLRPHICFAYPTRRSRGTRHMIEMCVREGIPTYVREQ